jgi:hypothetical protein
MLPGRQSKVDGPLVPAQSITDSLGPKQAKANDGMGPDPSVKQTIEQVEALTGCPVQIIQDSSIKRMAVLDIARVSVRGIQDQSTFPALRQRINAQ